MGAAYVVTGADVIAGRVIVGNVVGADVKVVGIELLGNDVTGAPVVKVGYDDPNVVIGARLVMVPKVEYAMVDWPSVMMRSGASLKL